MTDAVPAEIGEIPTQFGRYRTNRVIGTGGLSVLLEATDPDSGDVVAVKLLREGRSEDASRLSREADLLREHESRHLIALHDVGETSDGRPFLVLQLASRGSLSDRLVAKVRSDPWSTHRIVRALQVAVGGLHDSGVVHGDVHPGNLLIDCVGDVGWAGELTDPENLVGDDETLILCDLDTTTSLGDMQRLLKPCGTPRFCAPEQLVPDAAMGLSSDVYGATAVLWSVVTGISPPYPKEFAHAVQDVPGHWRQVLETGMHKDASCRFGSMNAWADAIVAALNTDLRKAGYEPLA